jgi:hypothetical protein
MPKSVNIKMRIRLISDKNLKIFYESNEYNEIRFYLE